MATETYPKTSMEFDEFFPTEKACREYLVQLRWPDGFMCPKCNGEKAWANNRHLLVCSACGHQASLTAGTIMEGTRKPLLMWFKAMWWVCTQKTGGSAKGLQRLLGLGSYQTAWAWLHKLRRAMIRAARERLVGPVEVDDGFVGGKEHEIEGRGTFKKSRIVVAVEIPGSNRKRVGRIRLSQIPDFSGSSLVPFVVENVAPGSKVITDGWHGYWPLAREDVVHETATGENVMIHAHRTISLLKRWLLGTHQGRPTAKHLQHYLEEFTFRHNRRKSRNVGKIFYRMLQGAAGTKPTPYWRLVGRRRPDQPLHVGAT